MNTPETPVYAKVMVPVVLLAMVIILPIYIYNMVKGFLGGTKNFVKGAANITSGLVSVARGVRIKNDPQLNAGQVRRIAIGALYANQQGGYVDALRMDINPVRLNTVLADWWGINNREDAIETMQYLCQASYSRIFPVICKAFSTEGVAAQKDIISKAVDGDEESFDDIWQKLMNLKSSYDDLVTTEVIRDKAYMERVGVMGWDAGRLNFVARACLEKGYISEEECWQFVDHAYDMAHGCISSWHDLANSYMLGRALWNGDTNMYALAKDLLSKPESPWVCCPW